MLNRQLFDIRCRLELETSACQSAQMRFDAMDLNDVGWTGLEGGYRVPYDPRKALRMLEEDSDVSSAWDELWNNLHHQGDIGEASYAAAPQLVRIHEVRGIPDWNTYALLATIEEARQIGRNPPLPVNLRASYETAWRRLVELGLRELREAEAPRSFQASLRSLQWERACLRLVGSLHSSRKMS